jgi:hypothetical protein
MKISAKRQSYKKVKTGIKCLGFFSSMILSMEVNVKNIN